MTPRGEHGRWLPGVSPNPGGRARGVHDFRALARQHGPKALRQVVAILEADDTKTSDRLRAAQLLIEWGYGKVVTQQDGQPAAADVVRLFEEAANQ